MKKILIAFFALIFYTNISNAQNMRLNAYSAYVFDDAVDSRYDANNYYNGTVRGGYQWGLGFEFMASNTKGVELKYLRQDTKAPMVYNNGGLTTKNKIFDVGLNYVMLGGANYFQMPGSKVEPFFGAGIGMAIINIKNYDQNGSKTTTKFAWDLKGGTNIWFSEKVGLKLQAELLSVVQGAGGGLYFGTGGVGGGVSTYSTMYQFGLGGGLTVKLGGKTATAK